MECDGGPLERVLVFSSERKCHMNIPPETGKLGREVGNLTLGTSVSERPDAVQNGPVAPKPSQLGSCQCAAWRRRAGRAARANRMLRPFTASMVGMNLYARK